MLTLEIYAVAAFEIKDLTGFVGGCDSGPKVLNNAADFRDLLGVAFGKLSAADEQAVFRLTTELRALVTQNAASRMRIERARTLLPEITTDEVKIEMRQMRLPKKTF